MVVVALGEPGVPVVSTPLAQAFPMRAKLTKTLPSTDGLKYSLWIDSIFNGTISLLTRAVLLETTLHLGSA
jgi:hypothetical protein